MGITLVRFPNPLYGLSVSQSVSQLENLTSITHPPPLNIYTRIPQYTAIVLLLITIYLIIPILSNHKVDVHGSMGHGRSPVVQNTLA